MIDDIDPSVISNLDAMRLELYERGAPPSREWLEYKRALGIDHDTIAAHAGVLCVLPLQYFANRTFDFVDEDGILSAICEVLDTDGETTVDLAAWPLHRPEKIATVTGYGDALGFWQVENPATYFGGAALRIHRTADAWFRAGCCGVVPLNLASAPRWLSCAPGNLLAEDRDHGWQIARAMHGYFEPRRILAPVNSRRAA